MPARLDIALQRNEDWSRTLTLTDYDGAALDLTDCILAMQVRDKLDQALVATAEVTISNPIIGLVDVTLRSSEGTPLGFFGNSIQVANLHYDLRLIDAVGIKTSLLAGVIILSRGETRQ